MKLFEPGKIITCWRSHAISHIFADDPQFINFVFSEDRSELHNSPSKLVRQVEYLDGIDRQQALLVRVALDIWGGTKFTRLSALYAELSDFRLDNVIRALVLLHQTAGCNCPMCKRRPNLSTRNSSATTINN